MRNLWEKFEEEIDESRGFDWKPEWDLLEGVEEFPDYVRTFTGNSMIPLFDKEKHLIKSFSGFTALGEREVLIQGVNTRGTFSYIEKGKIRFLNSPEGKNKITLEKNLFINGNFHITKSYKLKENSFKLNDIYREAYFDFEGGENLSIRQNKDKVRLFLEYNSSGIFLFFDLDPSLFMKNFPINSDLFKDFNKFLFLVGDLRCKILGKDELYKENFRVKNALKLIKSESDLSFKSFLNDQNDFLSSL